MSYFWLPVGLALPTIVGWLLLSLVEGKTPVLFRSERIVAGFVLGCVLVPFALFLTEASGIGSFGLASMLLMQSVVIGVLATGYWLLVHKKVSETSSLVTNYQSLLTEIKSWKLWQKILGGALAVWFLLKLAAMWVLLIGPAYFDDTVKNWNLRAKMFYVQKELVLEVVPGKGVGGVGSYPPTVSLMKTWLVSLNGGWHEGLANAIHMLWFFAALILLYFVLRRLMSATWSLLGTYVLSSIPLYALHGGIAYADQFLSCIVFIAVSWLFLGLQSEGASRESFLRIAAVAAGLLMFTKNEAILLFLPPLGLLVFLLLVTQYVSRAEKQTLALWYSCSVLFVGLPWLLFKWSNNLNFGNAKPLSGLTLSLHEEVLPTIFANTFLMGHWSLLPILFVVMLIIGRKTILRSPLLLPAIFFALVWLMQLSIFVFTELYTEALNQTGYARGIIHLIPIVVLITITCLHRTFRRKS